MALDTDLGPLTDLAESLGILVDGEFNRSWWGNPLGRAAENDRPTQQGLTTALYDDRQREALIAFADRVLGDPGRRQDEDGATWLPLVSTTGLTVYAVIEEPAGQPLHVGIGAEYATSADNVDVAVTAHVRAFRVDRQDHPLPASAGPAPWLLLGQPDGTIDLSVEVATGGSPTPGEFFLGGMTVAATIPTSPARAMAVDLRLNRLQFPGSDTPADHRLDLDSPETSASDVLSLVAGLVRARADALDETDPATRPFAALASLIGLRTTAGITGLPVAEITERGIDTLVDWAEFTLVTSQSRDAWLAELAELLGGTPDPGRGAVSFTSGPVSARAGLKTTTGANGSAVLTPWLELTLPARDGADLVARADLFSIDTTTGSTTAFPVIECAAVFGERATNGSVILDDSFTVGTVSIGLRVADGRPAFSLLLHDVETPSGQPREVVDLSSPEAVRDVASSVVGNELTTLLEQLGDAGRVLARAIGLDPPTGVTGVDAVDLLTQPLPTVATYWERLVAAPTALAEVVASISQLILPPSTTLTGAGRPGDPWTLALGAAPASTGAAVLVWLDGTRVLVDLVVGRSTDVFTNYRAELSGRLALARIDPATPTVDLVPEVSARLAVTTADGSPVTLDLDPAAVTVDRLGVEVGWRARGDRASGGPTPTGLHVEMLAPGLAVDLRPLGGRRYEVPLPRFDAGGSLVWEPEWADVEDLLVSLLGRANNPALTVVLETIGWTGDGAYLPLVDLVTDPKAALARWLSDLVLDCGNVTAALTPLTELLSGFTLHQALGAGNRGRPYRAPLAGAPGAPALSAWMRPPCSPSPADGESRHRPGWFDPSPDSRGTEIAGALTGAGTEIDGVGDLLVGRPGLADGLEQLVQRLTGTDGVVGRPTTLPTGVTGYDAEGYSYRRLVALAAIDLLGPLVLGEQPAHRLYLGTEEVWADAFGTSVDRSTVEAADGSPGALADGPGPWSARLPSLAAAQEQRPDRSGLDEQARRIVDLVDGRTTPVSVIACGQAGAAAVRAAGLTDAIARVVTVGTPWSEPATDAFTLGRSGDALRLLTRLAGPPPDLTERALALEASPLTVLEHIIDRVSPGGTPPVGSDVTDLVDASGVPGPEGVPVDAVFGRLPADDVWLAVALLVEQGIDDRYEADFGLDEPADTEDDTADDGPDELHLGVDLPTLDLDLGGLLAGVGTRLETFWFDRDATTGELRRHDEQDVVLTLHLGLTDRWLVGGPGAAATDIEVRWVEFRITLPLDDRPSETAVVLHEARCFDVFRERWEIDAEQLHATTGATTSLPEVHLILGEVVRRLGEALPGTVIDGVEAGSDLTGLLAGLGITRDGGYDPAGLERFLFAPADSVARLLSDPVGAAGMVRGLSAYAPAGSALAGSGPVVEWTFDAAGGTVRVSADLADRSLSASLARDLADAAPLEAGVTVDDGVMACRLAVGAVTPLAGGIRLVIDAAAAAGGTRVGVEWAGPGETTPRMLDLTAGEAFTGEDLGRLTRLLAALTLAALARTGLEDVRSRMALADRAALDSVLDGLLLLDHDAVADGVAEVGAEHVGVPVRLPFGLFLSPLDWLRSAAGPWQTDPLGRAMQLLDAVAPLAGVAVPDGAAVTDERRWPMTDGVVVRYRLAGDRLVLGLDVTADHGVDGRSVTTGVGAGIALSAPPSSRISALPELSARFDIDGRGLRLLADPAVSLALVRRPPAPPLSLYPWSGDVGAVVESAAAMVVPQALDALAARRADAAASLTRSVGQVVFDLGSALDLLDGGQFSEPRVVTFAGDPSRALTDHVAAVGQVALGALVDALDEGGAGLVRRDGDRLVIGPPGPDRGYLALGFTDAGAVPAVEIDARLEVDDAGAFVLDRLRLQPDGLQVTASYEGEFDVGAGLLLRPVLAVSAGVTGAGFTRSVTAALALDEDGERTVGFRWGLDGSAPTLTGTAPAGAPQDAAVNLGLLALSLVTPVGTDLAEPVIGPRARSALRGVVLHPDGSLSVDPEFVVDLLDAEALVDRLFLLLANLGDAGLSVDIGSGPALTVGYFAETVGGSRDYGLALSLDGSGRFPLTDDPVVAIDVDAGWIDGDGPAGLTLVGVRQSLADRTQFSFAPRIIARGLGIRVGQQSGPLLDLGGLGIDAIALHLYGESDPGGAGVGARLEIEGLAFTPAGRGSNPVASGIMDDAAAAGGEDARPSFSPSFAVQRPPGADQDVSVSLRAGEPPGPWWLVVQRELGPLYLERFGFDSTEADGRVVGISLLFDGRVSLFGLTAQVDSLSIDWVGGSLTDPDQWHVDIRGFAVTADLSGVFISGGLLKTQLDGNPGYLGMLTGRFGVYGLSLFGGYTKLGDTQSFFVFGAVNGPIGGPPAFFLTGIGGGLGINRGLRVPDDIARLDEYPFIKALDAGSTSEKPPLDQLRELGGYFPVKAGNIWFAAGISFTSFNLVDGIAIVSVSFGSGLDINLMGLARTVLPRPESALVSIELGLLARFSSEEGLFLIQAQLTGNSWLLYPEVRLTGRFAFATWWKGPNAGQFVLTLGGYHPTFSRPGYPEVPRLGLVWQVSDAIVIKGSCYFALTSEALMAGLDVEVSADFGFAWARLAFGAHGIVYFDPFWFRVEAYVSISAGIKIKTFFGTIRISVSRSGSVLVEGPDVSGVATVEVGPAEFDMPFGSRRKDPRPAVTWREFVTKYLEEASPGVAAAISSVAGAGAVPAATGDKSSAPSPDGSADRPFQVLAEFELTVVTIVPFTQLRIGAAEPRNVRATRNDGSDTDLGLAPMQARGLEPMLSLSLHYEVAEEDYELRPEKMTLLAQGLTAEPADGEAPATGATYGFTGFPLGVWGLPHDSDAEVKPLPSPEVVFAGSRVTLVSAAPLDDLVGPQIQYRSVDPGRRPLPLSAGGPSRATMLGLAGNVPEVTVANAEQAVATARRVLFDGPEPTPRGGRSRLARAGYRGWRTAPPMFGTLTEGIDLSNPLAARTSVIAPGPGRDKRAVRLPTILGYAGAGSGRSQLPTSTTVADKRAERRPAPSTAAVTRRLGTTLALDLHRSSVLPALRGGTVLTRSALPHTADVSPWVETDRHALDDMARSLVVGADRPGSEASPGVKLVAGEALVLGLPDADIDLDAARRPTIDVSGPARLVAVAADGSVLAERRGGPAPGALPAWPVPVGTSRVVAVSGAPDDQTGTAGWVDASRLLWTGMGTALGHGCVVRFDSGGTPRRVGWHRAGGLASSADTVTTSFTGIPRTVAVLLTDDEPLDRSEAGAAATLDGVGVALRGLRVRAEATTRARIRTGAGPAVRPPVVVQSGAYSVVVVPVEADPGQPDGRPRVQTDLGRRRVAGILGSDLDPGALAERVAADGPHALVTDLTARSRGTATGTCTLTWTPAPPTDAPRTTDDAQ